ncbi:MAG TPA: Hpt domain-containing protein [Stellaceae bacterium]|nr:Hpt domain-containing protein [Stellaceae bacterium]
MSETPVLDTAVLDDLVEHIGADAVCSIVEIFIGECRELAATINGAATPQAVGRAAHSLKSSAGQLGAAALAEAALAVETAAENNSPALRGCIAALIDCAAVTEPALVARLEHSRIGWNR